FLSITQRGYIKRVSDSAYRSQGRGGRGVMGQTMRDEDEVHFFVRSNTLATLLFFTDKGKVYSERVFELPEESRQGKGLALVNIINLEPDENVTALLSVPDFRQANYCTMATRRGRVKRIALAEFANVRPSGLIAIKLDEDDRLGWVCLTSGKDDVLLVTRAGKTLRFSEEEIRPTGRTTMGVTGIHMRAEDALAAMAVVEPGGYLLVLTEKGYGKRTPLDQYRLQTRGGKGVINMRVTAKTGEVMGAVMVQESDEIVMLTSTNKVIRIGVGEISLTQGRATQGVRLVRMDGEGAVAGFDLVDRGLEQDA
ncbi:MAG TPA: DNA gyrase subunit A, partial [Desulfovibrio sp.]|nr:DNA gyrase subunit A [Desulfovibrio sp.]